MGWGAPQWWWALAAVFAVALAVGLGGLWHRRRLRAAFGPELLARVVPTGVRVRRTLRDVATVVGLALVVIALVEPLYGKEMRQVDLKGVDVVLVVDLSRSMNAEDVSPSRLERARREIHDLLDLVEGDRIGLVIYAAGAFPRLPLTEDLDAVTLVVDELSTDIFTAQGSALGEGIRVATRLLSTSERAAGKGILVLSDGEVHNAADALAAAADAAAAGIRIYTLGIGEEPAPIPLPTGGVLQDEGRTVLSDPDPAVLRDVAQRTGGAYVDSVASASDMETLYRDELRGNLQATVRRTQQREAWRSGYAWPLGIGVAALLFAAWVGEGTRRFASAVVVLVFVAATASAQDVADADALFRAGRYDDAADAFTALTMEHPDDPALWERLGAARYRAGDPGGAARAYDTALGLSPDPDRLFASGNAHYLAGRLTEALDRYDRALAADPEHAGARANRDLLVNELTARRQIRPPPPPQPQPEPGEQGDEQGDPQEGEPQQGDPQQGDPQQGSPQSGDPQSGDPSQSSENRDPGDGTSGEPGEQEPGEGQDPSQERPPGEEHGTADLSEGQEGDPDGTTAGGDGAIDPDAGPVSQAQAERMLDGVEEGSPRIRIQGERAEKPW